MCHLCEFFVRLVSFVVKAREAMGRPWHKRLHHKSTEQLKKSHAQAALKEPGEEYAKAFVPHLEDLPATVYIVSATKGRSQVFAQGEAE